MAGVMQRSSFRVTCEVTGRTWRIHEIEDGRAVVRQCGAVSGHDGIFPDVATALTALQGWAAAAKDAA